MSDSQPSKMSRRTLLAGAAMSGAFRALAEDTVQPTDSAPAKLKICVFSKHLQWTSVAEAAAIARDIGFDGVDLTVRAGGHVLPERVEADLPTAVEAVRRAGLTVPMISTEIAGVQTPHAEAILKTASQLGIRQYRWGGLTYPADQGIGQRLDELKAAGESAGGAEPGTPDLRHVPHPLRTRTRRRSYLGSLDNLPGPRSTMDWSQLRHRPRDRRRRVWWLDREFSPGQESNARHRSQRLFLAAEQREKYPSRPV